MKEKMGKAQPATRSLSYSLARAKAAVAAAAATNAAPIQEQESVTSDTGGGLAPMPSSNSVMSQSSLGTAVLRRDSMTMSSPLTPAPVSTPPTPPVQGEEEGHTEYTYSYCSSSDSEGGVIRSDEWEALQRALSRAVADRDSLQLRYESVLNHYEMAYQQLGETQKQLRAAVDRERQSAERAQSRIVALEVRAGISRSALDRSLTEPPPMPVEVEETDDSGGEGSGMTARHMAAFADLVSQADHTEQRRADLAERVTELEAALSLRTDEVSDLVAERDALVRELDRLRHTNRQLRLQGS